MRCSSVFVSLRLKSLAVLPYLLPLFHYEKGVTAVFGMESGFSLGAEGGTRRGLFADVCQQPLRPCLLDLLSFGLAVGFAVRFLRPSYG